MDDKLLHRCGFPPTLQIRVANTVNKETIPAELDGMEINDMSLTYSVAVSALVAVRVRVRGRGRGRGRGSVCTQSMVQGRRGLHPTQPLPHPSPFVQARFMHRHGLRFLSP